MRETVGNNSSQKTRDGQTEDGRWKKKAGVYVRQVVRGKKGQPGSLSIVVCVHAHPSGCGKDQPTPRSRDWAPASVIRSTRRLLREQDVVLLSVHTKQDDRMKDKRCYTKCAETKNRTVTGKTKEQQPNIHFEPHR